MILQLYMSLSVHVKCPTSSWPAVTQLTLQSLDYPRGARLRNRCDVSAKFNTAWDVFVLEAVPGLPFSPLSLPADSTRCRTRPPLSASIPFLDPFYSQFHHIRAMKAA
jgi:hypothetical protein